MPTPPTPERVDLEWSVLRVLCSGEMHHAARYRLSLSLQPDDFLSPSNRVVYEEILSLGSIPRERLRELLATRVTRRGLPDLDFDELFAFQLSSPAVATELIQSLRRFEIPAEFPDAPWEP